MSDRLDSYLLHVSLKPFLWLLTSQCAKMISLIVFSIYCLNFVSCERRLAGGNFTSVNKNYAVYFVQSELSYPQLDTWLCGGALIRINKILTSAACLIESTNIYAVAGYKKYVSTKDLDNDNCTKVMRRRVIRTCVPSGYVFDPTNKTHWMTLDVGVAIVDRPYKTDELMFKLLCDYAPVPIPILYERHLITLEYPTLTLGWGFARGRRPGDPEDYNSKRLKFLSLMVANHSICKKQYPGMEDTIDKYMLCLDKRSLMDDDGLEGFFDLWDSDCKNRRTYDNNINCTEYRRQLENNKTMLLETRRQVIYAQQTEGLCQNDHGGPLTAYVGAKEMLIGIAVSTIYNVNYQCVTPSLFTSTACTSQIILCMLAQDLATRRSCNEAEKKAAGLGVSRHNSNW